MSKTATLSEIYVLSKTIQMLKSLNPEEKSRVWDYLRSIFDPASSSHVNSDE